MKRNFKRIVYGVFIMLLMCICLNNKVEAKTPSFKVSNFSVNKKTIRNGQKIKIKFKVKGKNFNPTNGAYSFSNGTGWSGGVFDYNKTTKYVTIEERITNRFSKGKIQLESITLYDKTGNTVTIKNSKLFKKTGKRYADMSKANFEVKGRRNPSFKVSNFSVNRKKVKNGQKIKIKFKVKGKNFNPTNGAYSFSNGTGWSGGVFDYNKTTKYVTIEERITNRFTKGKIQLESITLYDKIGNTVTIKNSKIYGRNEKNSADMSKSSFVVKGTTTPSFKVSNFSVNRKKVKNGQKIKIKFKVKGKNFNPTNGAYSFSNGTGWSGGVFDYNKTTKYVTIEERITNRFSKGKIQLESITLYDKTGNTVTIKNSKLYDKTGKKYADMSKADFVIKGR